MTNFDLKFGMNTSVQFGFNTPPPFEGSFRTTWKTDNVGDSSDVQIKLPLNVGGDYGFQVDWGDGSTDIITAWDQTETTHTYAAAGTYTVNITGTISRFIFNNGGDKLKLLTIDRWGPLDLNDGAGSFWGCANLTSTATDVPKIGNTLQNCFRDCSLFNGKVGAWQTGNVLNMNGVFLNAAAFDSDISGWDTGLVTTFESMFFGASIFNQAINAWNTSACLNMMNMFRDAVAFNQSLNSWNVSSVTNMDATFRNAATFNGSVGAWNVSEVLSMDGIFLDAISFDADVSGWSVAKVTTMNNAFRNADVFNQDLSTWDTGLVVTFDGMFFDATLFDQDISGWDTSSGETMISMLRNCPAFDQNLASWDITLVTNMTAMLSGTTLSTTNYDALLIGWEGQLVQNNVTFHGGSSTYTNPGAAATARANLIADHTWGITDGGPA